MKAKYPDAKIQLIEGGGGIFDVTCNDKLIFSRQKTEGRRFPAKGEIATLIEKEKSP